MATITKRQNKWQVRIRLSNYPTITKTFNLKSHAQVWGRETEIRLERGTFVERAEQTLGQILEQYLTDVTPDKRSYEIEKIRIKRILREPICKIKFSHLRARHFIKYRDDRLRAVSGTTVRHDLSLFSHVFTTAIKDWDMPINGNPVRLISKPKENKPRDRRLENGEEDRLLGSCGQSKNPYLLPLVTVAIETAMRRGELLGL